LVNKDTDLFDKMMRITSYVSSGTRHDNLILFHIGTFCRNMPHKSRLVSRSQERPTPDSTLQNFPTWFIFSKFSKNYSIRLSIVL